MRSVISLFTWMILIFLGLAAKSKFDPTRRTTVNKKTYHIERKNTTIRRLHLDDEEESDYSSKYEVFDNKNKTNNGRSSSVNKSLKSINFKIKDALGQTDYPMHGKLSRETREDEKEWFK